MNVRLPIVFLVVGLLLAVFPGRGVAQWKWLNPTPHGNRLHDVEFLTDNTAIAVGNAGTIMVTHDAGLSWTTSFRTNGEVGTFEKVARGIGAQKAWRAAYTLHACEQARTSCRER